MVKARKNVAYSLLFFSKFRVALTKPVTMPRLERRAAFLGVKLGKVLKRGLPNFLQKVSYWTDPTVVIYYIADTSLPLVIS